MKRNLRGKIKGAAGALGVTAVLFACTASNGQPVINLSAQGGTNQCRNDALYGACKRWIDVNGQRYTGSNTAYQAHVSLGAVGGLCTTAYVGSNRSWYGEPNDDTGCGGDANGWPLVYGFNN